ncbi:MAG TPA: HEAT repeat domain-containing protein [Candidatus Acidoferrales bacterium]|nr:HEAT repeat domain-containing protein [Candidatus Acidoferrales bacterium]
MSAAERLRSPDTAARLAAITEMGERRDADEDELHALAECLGHEKKVVQRQAAEAFAALNDRGITVRAIVTTALRSTAPRQQWGAAFALSLLGPAPPEALPVLLACLGNSDGDVRWAAANIMVRMRDEPRLVELLQDALCTGNPAQRKMAAYCLRDLDARSPAVQRALFDALRDAEPGVRIAVMSSLARLGVDRAAVAQRVTQLLRDVHDGVRRAAAAVLGSLGDRSEPVLAALRAAASERDPSLQRAAERSLRLLEAPR